MTNLEKANEREERLKRLTAIQRLGINPYPARIAFNTKSIPDLVSNFETFETSGETIGVRGRIRSKRAHGALQFIDLEENGSKIQLYIKQDEMKSKDFDFLKDLIDVGDFLAAEGVCTKTKRGERSLLVQQVQLLGKSLRPLPEKWHGLQDVETRFRKRELDLLSNKNIKDIFIKRSVFINSIRSFLLDHDCIEVETPVLQSIPGGAAAKPFKTHHNALDQDMYLRIAPELYLKRLIVGGFSRVFEIAKCFRNEGIDTQHNPEFTQVELYISYFDFEQLMTFVEHLLNFAVKKTLATAKVTFQEKTLSFAPPYPRKTFADVIKEYTKIDIEKLQDKTKLIAAVQKKGIEIDPSWGEGKILDELFKKHARPHITGPLFITHHPLALSPLAKKDQKQENKVERFQLLVQGMEVVNGFSELNDPVDQRKRFQEQEKLRSQGDEEAQFSDDMFVESLEYGLPPTAGVGIGIDRFIQLLTNSANIKEVIFFPTLRIKP